MRDDLPGNLPKGHFLILNLDDTTGGGTHWTALYNNGDMLYYFDSFGMPPPKEIKQKYKKKIKFSTSHLQNIDAISCGSWCIWWVLHVANGKDFYDTIYKMDIMSQKNNEKKLANFFEKI